MNTCRTCSTFSSMGGKCAELDFYPNVTISEYGSYGILSTPEKIKAEIYARGPVAAGVNAEEILEYTGGVVNKPNADKGVNHIVSIVGWAAEGNNQHWVVRNSWGEYWGERGFFRIAMGGNQLGIEDNIAWANPKQWTESNTPCYEDGSNCVDSNMPGRGKGFTHEDFKRSVAKQQMTGTA